MTKRRTPLNGGRRELVDGRLNRHTLAGKAVFAAQQDRQRRAEDRKRRLSNDPDVRRCQEERLRRPPGKVSPVLAEAKVAFEEQLARLDMGRKRAGGGRPSTSPTPMRTRPEITERQRILNAIDNDSLSMRMRAVGVGGVQVGGIRG